jgi:hypothetical protein
MVGRVALSIYRMGFRERGRGREKTKIVDFLSDAVYKRTKIYNKYAINY